ncbi:hypothetical protein T492DRAFT_875722, partial [Pavlovales sp. CCMP2436]
MRVFVHFEQREPAHTLALAVYEADGGVTAGCALVAFVAAYNAAHPAAQPLCAAELALVDGAGTALRPMQPLAACAASRGDLFVKLADARPAPPAMTATTVVAAPTPAAAAAAAATKALVAQGEAAFKAKRLRAASAAYEAVIALNPHHRASLSRLAEIEVGCERFEAAAAFLKRACDAARATALSAPTTPLLLARLADAYIVLRRPRDAVLLVREALDLCPEGEGGEQGAARRARLLVKLGRALYDAGDRKTGSDLFMAVLDKDQEHPEALVEYAAVALECGQDALKVNLRLVVKRPDDKKVRRALCDTIAADDGCAHLFEQLAPSASAAPAHAFLATVVKDHSHLE